MTWTLYLTGVLLAFLSCCIAIGVVSQIWDNEVREDDLGPAMFIAIIASTLSWLLFAIATLIGLGVGAVFLARAITRRIIRSETP